MTTGEVKEDTKPECIVCNWLYSRMDKDDGAKVHKELLRHQQAFNCVGVNVSAIRMKEGLA